MVTIKQGALQERTKKRRQRLACSFAGALCLGIAGAAWFTFRPVPAPRDAVICGVVAAGGFALWLIGSLFSTVTSVVREDLGYPLLCIFNPRYLGMILMGASTLTFSYMNYNMQDKLMPMVYSLARPKAASFPRVKLEGVLFNGNRSSALVNGELVQAGQKLNGVLVTEINANSIAVEFKGEKRIIPLSKQAARL